MGNGSRAAGNRRAARRLGAATAVPIAVALIAIQPGVAFGDPGLPEWQPLDIFSGSAAAGSSDEAGSDSTGISLDLGSATVSVADVGSSGSAFPGVADIAVADTGSAEIGIEPVASAPAVEPVAGTAGELLGFEPGSVLTACTGSAVLGSAALMLGSATGSALVGLGSSGSGWIGAGSGLLVPGLLIGPGSVGGGAGSVVVGSAALGSALLTCLLLLPVPDVPGIPLQIGPSPIAPVAAPIAPEEQPEPPPIVPPVPVPPPPPELGLPEPLPPIPEEHWSVLQMMTVMIITIIAAARVKTAKLLRD